MPIYQRALSPQTYLREQSTGLLGMGQPANLPGRPPIPQVSAGNVSFLQAKAAEAEIKQAQQQQILGSLLQLGGTAGAVGLNEYDRRKPQFSDVGRQGALNYNQQAPDPYYNPMLDYPRGTQGYQSY